jgi:hypothetical protein
VSFLGRPIENLVLTVQLIRFWGSVKIRIIKEASASKSQFPN